VLTRPETGGLLETSAGAKNVIQILADPPVVLADRVVDFNDCGQVETGFVVEHEHAVHKEQECDAD